MAPPAAAIPTQPLTASTILQTLLSHYRGHGCSNSPKGASAVQRRIRTGYAEVDDYILRGGVERGVVLGVSADIVEERLGRVISLHLLTSTLLSNPCAKASIIDTTGSFPVSLLADIFRSRLTALNQPEEGLSARRGAAAMKPDIETKTQELLQRVDISRTFDIEGVLEVLSEISDQCNKKHDDNTGKGVSVGLSKGGDEILMTRKPKATKGERGQIATSKVEESREVEILDSEAEDDDDSEPGLPLINTELRGTPSCNSGRSASVHGSMEIASRCNTELVIIDNMAAPVHEFFSRKEKNEAHTLLLHVSRTLHSLSQTHSILTILLNSLIKPRPSSSDSQFPNPGSSLQYQHQLSSIFTSTTERPSLGRLFSDLVSLHIMITRVPKTRQDAAALSSNASGFQTSLPPLPSSATVRRDANLQYCHVLEVLKDEVHDLEGWMDWLERQGESGTADAKRRKKQNREQRWAPIALADDGLRFVDVEFGGKSVRG